ncbi:MAG: thymidylate synthase [Alphaproteobacteria bacterium]|nr:thymidylate synthase [Alphaproteobacteria bacterium]
MKAYLDILENCLNNGTKSDNRTGIPTIRIPWGSTFQHDMSTGFPLLTTKKMGLKNIATELEFFIHGYTDKKWLQDRNCHIWDEWSNPIVWKPIYDETLENLQKKYADTLNLDDKTKNDLKNTVMSATRDLGPIYGWQWRHFGGEYCWNPDKPDKNYNPSYFYTGTDQLSNVIKTAKEDPNNRRLIVNAWNPTDQDKMALPPCHIMHQILIHDGKLNLIWTQRSCDMFLGIPYNIASYALLLLLYAKELGYKPGILRGELHDVHIYENHIPQVKEQLSRKPHDLPTVEIPDENWNGLLNWSAEKGFRLKNYICHEKLTGAVAR